MKLNSSSLCGSKLGTMVNVNVQFERLIGLEYHTFNEIAGKQSLDLDSFCTLFYEVSKMVNERLLTYVNVVYRNNNIPTNV